MCLAVPAKIEKIKGSKAIVSWGGLKKEIDISLIERPKKGDFVLVHVGFAIEILDPKLARETLRLFEDFIEDEKKQLGK
jgi:hydrogenase expression/formation protein HypC